MKVWITFIAKLSVVLLLTTGSGAQEAFGRTNSGAQEASGESQLTAQEEQEAREIAERFIRRMEETGDLAPLIEELFVADYAVRLQQEAISKPLPLLSQSVAEAASREELVRYQLVLNNSLYVATQLYLIYERSRPETDTDAEWGAAHYLRLLPPDIIELFKADPILKVLFEEEPPASADGNAPEASTSGEANVIDHDDEPVRTVGQLRGLTSTLEKAVVLARRHIAASPFKPNLTQRHKGANEEENWTEERKTMRPHVWLMLNRDSYGYPKGTKLICLHVLVYHMDLIRVDGKLKVLALYPDMD